MFALETEHFQMSIKKQNNVVEENNGECFSAQFNFSSFRYFLST